jgi:hypothetical protein
MNNIAARNFAFFVLVSMRQSSRTPNLKLRDLGSYLCGRD